MTPPRHDDNDGDDTGPAGDTGAGERLPCGADTDVLLAQVAEGRGTERDPHQAHCPHCQASLAEYTRLWAPFQKLAARPVSAPPAVTDPVLRAVRESAGAPGWGRVDDEPDDPDDSGVGGGSFLVAARAVVSVAGHAARTLPGVRVALSTLGRVTNELTELTGLTGGDRGGEGAGEGLATGLRGRSVALEVTVAAEYGQDLQRLAQRLRERVTAEVLAQTGLDVVNVDVTITDVFAPRP